MNKPELLKQLLEQLECPVCLEYMGPPITFCENGHNICSSCRPELERCPTCRQTFLKARNVALEKLAIEVECPCPNEPYGCAIYFPISLIRHHRNVCEYIPLDCPMKKSLKCEWKGTFKNMKDHITEVHTGWATDMSEMKHFLIKKFRKNKQCFRIFYIKNNIFFQQFEVIENAFYYVIQCVRAEEIGSKFRYEFVLQNDDEKISVCSMTGSNKVDVKEVYKSGECVKLYYDTLERFLGKENSLEFDVQISEIKVSK
jgi:E3 ubiquitin-protein ligase SIAH1